MSIENPFNNPAPLQEETPQPEKVEEVKNSKDIFFNTLNEELSAMEKAGIAEEKEMIDIFNKNKSAEESPSMGTKENSGSNTSEAAAANEGKQESREGGESLKENDLIVPDDEVGPIKNILEKNEIPYKDREYTKRQVIDAKTGTAVPGEFVLTIFDPERPNRPASFDFVKQVFKLIKDSNMVVRYGKNPERG